MTEPTRGGDIDPFALAHEITATYAPGEHGLTNRLAREFATLLARVQELEREREAGSFDERTLKYYGHIAMSNGTFKTVVKRAEAAEAKVAELEREMARLHGVESEMTISARQEQE